jgi:hypothetical protein
VGLGIFKRLVYFLLWMCIAPHLSIPSCEYSISIAGCQLTTSAQLADLKILIADPIGRSGQ